MCFYYDKTYHCSKRNYHHYISFLKTNKGNVQSLVYEIHTVDGHIETWHVDTRSIAHICYCLNMFQETRSLTNKGLDLKVESGEHMKVEAISIVTLHLSRVCILIFCP